LTIKGEGNNTKKNSIKQIRKDKKAVSPALSTMIITGAVISMILVTVVYSNNFLNARLAENEFSSIKQFLSTTGLQIDDIAWTIGRTQTVHYSSRFGNMAFQNETLNYTFEARVGSNWKTLATVETGIIMFNVPASTFSMGNNYFDRISPSLNGAFLQRGSTAPVAHVFALEKLPMAEGNYTRIVVAPTIRMLNSTIAGPQQGATRYYKFYLPTLETGNHLYRSQSISMTGSEITKISESGVNEVKISVTFPNGDEFTGFNSDFFRFDNDSEEVTLPGNSVVELYIGSVIVTLGKV